MDGDNPSETAWHDDIKSTLTKKAWIAPDISESPINELTHSSILGRGVDGGIYS